MLSGYTFLSFIPPNVLFKIWNSSNNWDTINNTNSNNDYNYNSKNIELFELSHSLVADFEKDFEIQLNSIVKTFCDKYNRYSSIQNNNVRQIKQLKLGLPAFFQLTPNLTIEHIDSISDSFKLLLTTLSNKSCYKSLHLYSGELIIKTIDELKSIFHLYLQELKISWDALLIIKINILDDKCIDGNSNTNVVQCICPQLKYLTLAGSGIRTKDKDERLILLNNLDKFGISKNVQMISVETKMYGTGVYNWNRARLQKKDKTLLKHLFFNNFDKHQFLKTIKIIINDQNSLHGCAKIFLFFNKTSQ